VTILADSGYWIALLDHDDRHHQRAISASQTLTEQLVVTWPVLAETTCVLGKRLGAPAAQDMLRLGELGAYHIHTLTEHDLPQLRGLMEKYADLPMDLADASLVLLAERSGDGRILSTDQRDFRTYRFKQHKPFRNLLLADLSE
jgi:predicted nucleic acid-binding protein